MQCWPDEREKPPRVAMWLAVLLLTLAAPMIGVGLAAATNWAVLEWMQ